MVEGGKISDSEAKELAKELPNLIVKTYIEPIHSLARFYFSVTLIYLIIFNVISIGIFYPFQDMSWGKVIVICIALVLSVFIILPLLKNFFWRSIKTVE